MKILQFSLIPEFCQLYKDNGLGRANLAEICKSSGLWRDEETQNTVRARNANTSATFRHKRKHLSIPLDYLHQSHKYLTEDELKLVINYSKLLWSMGIDIDAQVCLVTSNTMILTQVD